MTASPRPFPTALVTVLGAGVLLSALDAFITFAATPAIQRDLGAGGGEAQLLIGVYVVVLAATVVTGARLGDRLGLRRAFRLGMGVFAVASLLCALAPSAGWLLAARVLQGAGAGIMAPQALGGIRRFVDPVHSARATGWIGVLGGLGATAGQLVGGALIVADVGGTSWRGCFLINVPIALAAIVAAGRIVPASAPRRTSFDHVGTVLSAAGAGAVVFAATQGRELGWPAWAVAVGLGGVAAIVGFVRHERRLDAAGGAPLIPPALLAAPGFRSAVGAVALFFTTSAGFYLCVALMLQDGLGLNPLASGLAFVPFGVAFYVGSSQSHRVGARGAEPLAVLVTVLGHAGLIALLATLGTAAPVVAVSACGLLVGLGQGACVGVLLGRAIERAPEALAGAAGGVITMAQQLGGAAGVALVGGTLFGVAGTGGPAALVHGFVAATTVVIALLAALVTVLRPPRVASRTPVVTQE